MNDREKKEYLDSYKKAKEHGVPFFPDVIFKDAVISLLVFIVLVALAYFVGAPVEERANPNDTTYTPRPEWYFLFLFQMLKYFPGKLEVIGAIIIPTIGLLVLLGLPFIDRSRKRHFLDRPILSLGAIATVGVMGLLTFLSIREPPPPQAQLVVDQAAVLYAANCANCHGPRIDVPVGTDLHQIIAAGRHEAMPPWGGDLSTDEIDALAGFILSPDGHVVFNQQCATCHDQMVQAVGNPAEIQRVLSEGPAYPPHAGLAVADWEATVPPAERNALANFLAAPDGQRLFAVNCSGCHGEGVAFSGSKEELERLVREGGQHLNMPAWKETLTTEQISVLAAYVVNPGPGTEGESLFGQYCTACHGSRIPHAPDNEIARNIIRAGGSHLTMPVWGDILTGEQLQALVDYTYEAGRGRGPAAGSRLYAENCAGCHGAFGQGGANPARAGDLIAPISSSEYLATRDDQTLRRIIGAGQPDFGMSPFAESNGGPLTGDQIDAIVTFIRGWEANPPAALPPEVAVMPEPTWTSAQVYGLVCASCHGTGGEGGLGPALSTDDFRGRYDVESLIDTITGGHASTPMIGWGTILSSQQIEDLADYVLALQGGSAGSPVSFGADILPTLQSQCSACHNASAALGGWDASTYESVISSGDNGPAVIPGDASSLLAQRLQGIGGAVMPPSGALAASALQMVLDWISAGAPDN